MSEEAILIKYCVNCTAFYYRFDKSRNGTACVYMLSFDENLRFVHGVTIMCGGLQNATSLSRIPFQGRLE
jgi:hypothetical protein